MKKGERYNEYMREYMINRYHRIRNKIIRDLGGKCAVCLSTNKLEIDHIDAKKKTMDVSRICTVNEARRVKELENCQILCNKCHEEKTILDNGNKKAKGTHGTLSSYRYCKCELCRQANRNWTNEYRKKNGRRKRRIVSSAVVAASS